VIRRVTSLPALLALACASPAQAFDPAQIGRMVEASNFAGVILVSRGDTIIYERAFGEIRPGSGEMHTLEARWRWASITKQIVATLAMQEVAAGRLALDAPIADYWPDFPNVNRDTITIRQLLQHRSGLPDPDDTPPNADGLPLFYTHEWADRTGADGYCAGPSRAEPGGYHYNNCDYIVLGGLLERVTGARLSKLVVDRIPGSPAFFPDDRATVAGFDFGQPEPAIAFAAYGAAGGLNGTLLDLWRFDRALMTETLLDEDAREEMWTGDPAIGYAALGQWVYRAPLTGCREPVRIVARRGAIRGVQGRNFILPETDMTIIAFTNRAEGEFEFGDIWRGEGFAHDLLALAACHWDAP